MKDILAEIVAAKRDVIEAAKAKCPLEVMRQQAEAKKGSFAMQKALEGKSWSLIAECKLQSPAKGNFGHKHSVAELAQIYEAAGATMLSVHTDAHFLGKNEDIPLVKSLVKIPVMRKEFIIDEYQIYETRALGADAILLIARILTQEQLAGFLQIAHDLGMDALVEVHDELDIQKALLTDAKFIGINNRNLKTFTTDIQNTLDLLSLVDSKRYVISESGIHSIEDVQRLYKAGIKGILVGEGLSTSTNVAETTQSFANID